jgi:hypothetical protein
MADTPTTNDQWYDYYVSTLGWRTLGAFYASGFLHLTLSSTI